MKNPRKAFEGDQYTDREGLWCCQSTTPVQDGHGAENRLVAVQFAKPLDVQIGDVVKIIDGWAYVWRRVA